MKKLAFLGISLLCAACATSPEPDYFMLAPVAGAASPVFKGSVHVQRPELARYLDRPEFVTQSDAVQVTIDDTHQWAEPLDVMLERTLATDLRQRLPMAAVTTESAGSASALDVFVAVDVQRFNAIEPGRVFVQAQITLRGKTPTGTAPITVIVPVYLAKETSMSGAEQALTLSTLVGQMADKVVATLTSPPAPSAAP